ncbi:MAG: phospholipid carrier-dependent glycosyltransferase [Betaproteobacteria bacterium]
MPTLRWFRSSSALLLAILLAGWFGNLEHRGLFFPDEGRYAEIPREMLASGDWTTPRLNDLKYFEKPPLQYWLTAVSFAAFGEDEWTARLPAALLGFAALLMVAWTARHLWGGRAGMLAGAITGSTWGFYLSGQYLTLDMTLSAFLTIALCAFLLAQRESGNEAQRKRTATDCGGGFSALRDAGTAPLVCRRVEKWMLVAWGMTALAMLSKGLIAVVLPALALASYSFATRDFRIWRRLHARKGSALFALIVLPWLVLIQWRNPEFFQFFVFHEHFERFLEPGHARNGAWWYYLPLVVIGAMPWTPLLAVRAMVQFKAARIAPTETAEAFDVDRFCLAWAIAIVVFFSLSQSKLPAYIVPAFPALALWASHLAPRARTLALRWSSVCVVFMALLLVIAMVESSRWPKFAALGPDGIAGVPILVASALALGLSGALAFRATARRRVRSAVTCLVAGSLLFWGGVFTFLHQTDAHFSSERLIELLTGGTKPFEPAAAFFSVNLFDPSLPFYLGRPVTVVKARGELGPGIDAEPEKAVASLSAFQRIWADSSDQAYAAMSPADFEKLQRVGVPMTRVVEDYRVVVVSRHERQPARWPAEGPAAPLRTPR